MHNSWIFTKAMQLNSLTTPVVVFGPYGPMHIILPGPIVRKRGECCCCCHLHELCGLWREIILCKVVFSQ